MWGKRNPVHSLEAMYSHWTGSVGNKASPSGAVQTTSPQAHTEPYCPIGTLGLR
jgi:hypothetical protein